MMAPSIKPAHPALIPMASLLARTVVEGVTAALVERVGVVNEGVDAGPDDVGDAVGPPRGAVDCPAISARTVEEKVPVIFVRLFGLKTYLKTSE